MLTSEIILSQLNFDKWRINLFWIGVLEEKQVNSKKVLILLIKIFIILMLNLSGKMPVNDATRGPQILETHLIYAWFHWAKSEVFRLGISSVNVIRYAGNFIFGYIYWKNPQNKTFALCPWIVNMWFTSFLSSEVAVRWCSIKNLFWKLFAKLGRKYLPWSLFTLKLQG